MLQSAGAAGCAQLMPTQSSRALNPARQCLLRKPSRLCWQPPVRLDERPACRPLCSAPAAVTEAVSTAADAELPSAAEQATMDAVAAELVAKLDAACAQMEPDDVDIGAYPDGDAGAADAEPAAASAGRAARPSGRKRKPLAKEVPADALPKVAIVGRPNVGKSALFNRLTGSGLAIVYDYPGVTRDRLYTRAAWGDREFVVVDTGGLMSEAAKLPSDQQPQAMRSISAAGIPQAIERQAAAGVAEADCIVLVVDGQSGVTGADEEIVTWLRRTHPKKPVTLAVNKCENAAVADQQAADFWALGLEPIAVSAISGSGTGDLLDHLAANLPALRDDALEVELDRSQVAVAIVGRPNVGKSSLVNAITGEERSIVSSMSGTTRDAIDTDITGPDGRTFKLIDTAGIRRRTAVAGSPDGAEPLSVERAFRAIRRSDVVALVIDAVDGITQQDFRLAELIAAEGRACVVIVNKWDAVPNKETNTLRDFEADLKAQLRPIDWALVVFTSATTGQRVARVLDAVAAAAEQHRRRITTATLNMVVREAVGWRSPPSRKGDTRKGRIYYGTQAATRPPSFVLFVNDVKLFGDDYKLYMERQIRENVGYPGTPLRLFWRGKAPSTSRQKSLVVAA